jgi:hypothetical protein
MQHERGAAKKHKSPGLAGGALANELSAGAFDRRDDVGVKSDEGLLHSHRSNRGRRVARFRCCAG